LKRINAEYFETCKQLVRNGAGVAVVGVASHENGLGDGIVALPIDPVLSYDMSIVTPARPGPSAVARLFVDDLRTELESFRID
jgi:DNA-binding transcriptional LysR family regulator